MKENNRYKVHDRFVRDVFSDIDVAKDLFKSILPKSLVDQLDFDTLKLTNSNFIDSQNKEKRCDLVLEIFIKGSKVPIILALEHQSTNDPKIIPRIIDYNSVIKNQYRRDKKNKDLPKVINVLISAAKKKYDDARKIFVLYDNRPLPNEDDILLQAFDLGERTVEQIIAENGNASLAFIAIKFGILGDHSPYLEKHPDQIKKLVNESSYAEKFLNFIIKTCEINKEKSLYLIDLITENKTYNMTTLAEDFVLKGKKEGIKEGILLGEQKGKKEGIKEGKKEGILDTARNMLNYGADFDLISKFTGLPIQEIQTINKH